MQELCILQSFLPQSTVHWDGFRSVSAFIHA